MFIHIKCLTKNIDSKTCFIPKDIFYKLKLKEGIKYRLHVGQLSTKIAIEPNKENDSKSMYLSQYIINKLCLFLDITLNIWKNDNDIYLGPVVGIMENNRYLAAIKDGKPHISASMYAKANRKAHCLLYFFNPIDINYTYNKFNGFYFEYKDNKWKQKYFPVPDVIYDRCSVIDIVQNLSKKYNTLQLINSNRRIDKWSLFRELSKYPEIKRHLPETMVYESFEDLKKMLKEYGFVFLKSFYGSSGVEVLSVDKKNNRYIVNFFQNGLRLKELDNIEELKEIVEKFTHKKYFIIQQGIRLFKYKGRNMDVRVLIQKDNCDEWKVTAYWARVANGSFTITNCCIGGESERYKKIYESINNRNYLPSEKELEETTIKIAKYIEKEYGRTGELGMDMAIDEKGKIWILEANKIPANGSDNSNEFLSILEYAIYLSKNNR